ncbi:hypothetical protein ABZP36_015591 [Zizania latifolia]
MRPETLAAGELRLRVARPLSSPSFYSSSSPSRPQPPRASALRIPLREVATLNLSHSLLTLVAAAGAARCDDAAESRVRRIASRLYLFSSRGAWALSWDYLRHYATASTRLLGSSLLRRRLSRLRPSSDATRWLGQNYEDVRDAASQLLPPQYLRCFLRSEQHGLALMTSKLGRYERW